MRARRFFMSVQIAGVFFGLFHRVHGTWCRLLQIGACAVYVHGLIVMCR